MNKEKGNAEASLLIYLALVVWAVASWLTHVVVCIKAGSWGFLIAGAIFAPIGMIHGTGIWFGWF
jgi:hypothetical protein